MLNRRSALAGIAALATLAGFGPAAAKADDAEDIVVTFHDATYPSVGLQVRLGNSNDATNAIPFADQTLTKDQRWGVPTNGLVVFWRREANPGSGDGAYSAWQRISTRQSMTQDL